MNKGLLFLIVIGLAVAGWLNRATISGWVAQKRTAAAADSTEEAAPPPTSESEKPHATPNPARQAIEQARETYPALAKAGSAFNLRFVALFNESKVSNPDFLAQPNWPVQLAERTAKDLGGGAIPRLSKAPTWTDNYADAVENAKMENKKLLLDFTGSDWCGYCMALEKEVLNTPKFQAWASENVVLVRVDFPRNHPQSSRLKQQNAELKSKYPTNGYPTLLVVDTTGKVLGQRSGYNPGSGPDAYLAALESTMRR